MRAVFAAIAALHVGGGWALLQIPAVREAVTETLPVFVSLVPAPEPPAPEVPPPPPPEVPTPVPPAPAPVMAAPPSPAPAPMEVPPPPPEPAPEPAPAVATASPPAPPASSPPAAPAPVAEIETVDLTAVQYLVPAVPVHSALSQKLGEYGTVVLQVRVDADGVPRETRLVKSSGYTRLNDAATVAARKARFKPYLRDGRAVPVWVNLPFEFEE